MSDIPVKAETHWLDDVVHYRLVPGTFNEGINYHFDGLASVMAFKFNKGKLSYFTKHFKSPAQEHWSQSIFMGTGTGPTLGWKPCVQNPVSVLPYEYFCLCTQSTCIYTPLKCVKNGYAVAGDSKRY